MITGLTSAEAQEKLAKYGPNAIQEEKPHVILDFLAKFWSPVPWMLEIAFILQFSLGKKGEATVTICLLLFNVVVSFIQEKRAQNAVSLLKKQLQIKARVLRDQNWKLIDAKEIVIDDVIRVRMGDFIPADLVLLEGDILVDRSALTGESIPLDLTKDQTAFSGSIVKRGEATGRVIATGKRSFFGKTAELVRLGESESHFEKTVLNIVEYLVSIDIVLVVLILIYASVAKLPLAEILPFALVLLIVSIPAALPATFTLMSALASLKLAKKGILVTRLTAIEEAAAMQILCSDKTGTLTRNQLTLKEVKPIAPLPREKLLSLAAYASRRASQDPFDMAILAAAPPVDLQKRVSFTPFDSMTKQSEAIVSEEGKTLHITKGAPKDAAIAAEGNRVLSVEWGEKDRINLAGYLIFSDPVRSESKKTVEDLAALGVNVKMVTGDLAATAQTVAAEVGLGMNTCPKEKLLSKQVENYDIFAEVFPQDKFHLIQALQEKGFVVGMTGDGVNDAPALKQADAGVAVSNATDVAKAAASIILTSPGLQSLIEAIKVGREVYRRMLTYTINKVVKTTDIALFMTLGLLFEKIFVISPHLLMFLIFANDFVTMSLASDTAKIWPKPCRLKIESLVPISLGLGLCWLLFYFGVFFAAKDYFKLSPLQIQTLIFLCFVFSGLATVYLVRTREHTWKIPPGKFLLASTIGDILVVSALAYFGVMMAPLSLEIILLLLFSVICFLFLLDWVKVAFGSK
jgi:H+-transporting ATPase